MSNGPPTPSRGSRGSIKGTMDIQGLIALAYQPDAKATFDWMVANPESNPQLTDNKKFIGIGGHLFAIAVDKSIEYGTDGEFYGFAANEDLLKHYIKTFNATFIGALHDYHFIIEEEAAKEIRKEYTYEWTDEEV